MFQNLSVHSDQILDILRKHANAQELSLSTVSEKLFDLVWSLYVHFVD